MFEEVFELFARSLKNLEGGDVGKLQITPSTQAKFGDLQTNVAMQHAKILKKSPMQVAELILEGLESCELFEKIEVVLPGFINITLSSAYLAARLFRQWEEETALIPQIPNYPVVVIDYSSPNVAKTMHVAHLRSTIIGDALKRIYQACGYKVIADNHIGDWGTQFGKLLYAWHHFEKPLDLDENSVEMLEKLYQEFVRKAEEDPSLDEEARTLLVYLQKKKEPWFSLWKRFIEISLKEFQSVYDRLGVSFDYQYGESFYNDDLQTVVDELLSAGFAKRSEGACVVFFEDEKYPPCIVQKNNGSFLYATTDLATVRFRNREFSPYRVLYVTDSRQKLHFQQVFEICKAMNWKADLSHITFGLMKFGEGMVMSTRKGAVISLKSFLDEAQKKAYEIVKDQDYSEEEKQEIARVVGIGAIKYQDLSQNPSTDIVFTWEKALNMEGNSAPYLQYAYARVCGIYRKYEAQFGLFSFQKNSVILDEDTRAICLHLLNFGKVVDQARESMKPNLIAEYLFDLASLYASFYNRAPILREENPSLRDSRMAVSLLSAKILKKGLSLLGIETLEKM